MIVNHSITHNIIHLTIQSLTFESFSSSLLRKFYLQYVVWHYILPKHIGRLTFNFIKVSIDKSKRHLSIPLNFIHIYQESCQGTTGIYDKFDQTNLEMRQRVRDSLTSNEFIFVDPNDVDAIYLAQQALDEFDKIPEGKM